MEHSNNFQEPTQKVIYKKVIKTNLLMIEKQQQNLIAYRAVVPFGWSFVLKIIKFPIPDVTSGNVADEVRNQSAWSASPEILKKLS